MRIKETICGFQWSTRVFLGPRPDPHYGKAGQDLWTKSVKDPIGIQQRLDFASQGLNMGRKLEELENDKVDAAVRIHRSLEELELD